MPIQQIIAVRKDLHLKKSKMAECVSNASMLFILENAEWENTNKINLTFNQDEVDWLHTGQDKIIVAVNSQSELENLMFKAKLNDIEAHALESDEEKFEQNGEKAIICAAFGPAGNNEFNQIFGKLKHFY